MVAAARADGSTVSGYLVNVARAGSIIILLSALICGILLIKSALTGESNEFTVLGVLQFKAQLFQLIALAFSAAMAGYIWNWFETSVQARGSVYATLIAIIIVEGILICSPSQAQEWPLLLSFLWAPSIFVMARCEKRSTGEKLCPTDSRKRFGFAVVSCVLMLLVALILGRALLGGTNRSDVFAALAPVSLILPRWILWKSRTVKIYTMYQLVLIQIYGAFAFMCVGAHFGLRWLRMAIEQLAPGTREGRWFQGGGFLPELCATDLVLLLAAVAVLGFLGYASVFRLREGK